jgi:hypothetical protein
MSTPPEHSPAYLRFKASMQIDYGKWRDGEPYDIAALDGVTEDERFHLAKEIADKSNLDWRDVEALKALGTTIALKRLEKAAEKQTDGGGIEAFMLEIESDGWSDKMETRFIEKLEQAQVMTGALDRLFEIAEAHPTPAVRKQLMRGARISGDPTTRYSMGAFLLYLAGHVDSHYVFDTEHRPHLLDLNSDDYKTYKAAVAWLENKIANPKTA